MRDTNHQCAHRLEHRTISKTQNLWIDPLEVRVVVACCSPQPAANRLVKISESQSANRCSLRRRGASAVDRCGSEWWSRSSSVRLRDRLVLASRPVRELAAEPSSSLIGGGSLGGARYLGKRRLTALASRPARRHGPRPRAVVVRGRIVAVNPAA